MANPRWIGKSRKNLVGTWHRYIDRVGLKPCSISSKLLSFAKDQNIDDLPDQMNLDGTQI